jgi:hypothetical protein
MFDGFQTRYCQRIHMRLSLFSRWEQIMRLLPYETFTIETSLPMSQAAETLRQNVEPISARMFLWFMFWKKHKTFEGIVSELEFRISRITYRSLNSRPFLDGHLESSGSGTILMVDVKLYFSLRLIILFSWIVLGLGCIGNMWESMKSGPAWTFLFGILMLVVFLGYPFLIRSEFRKQTNATRTALQKIFAESSKP